MSFITEEDWRAHLDEHSDGVARQAYADWLEEQEANVCWRCRGTGIVSIEVSRWEPTHIDMTCRVCNGTGNGDESNGFARLAAGYRELGRTDRFPLKVSSGWAWFNGPLVADDTGRSYLPCEWFAWLTGGSLENDGDCRMYPSRKKTEDAAASAWEEP